MTHTRGPYDHFSPHARSFTDDDEEIIAPCNRDRDYRPCDNCRRCGGNARRQLSSCRASIARTYVNYLYRETSYRSRLARIVPADDPCRVPRVRVCENGSAHVRYRDGECKSRLTTRGGCNSGGRFACVRGKSNTHGENSHPRPNEPPRPRDDAY